MEKLRIAALSKWHVHAEQYANEFAARDDAEIVYVWDSEIQRGKKWAESMNCAFEADLSSVLAREDVDAVAVCTETARHREVITAAARAGKHIYTEKVLAATVADAAAIKAAVEAAGVKFCISFPYRTRREFLCAKALADSGAVGDITLIRVRNAHDGAVRGWLPEYFYDTEVCGGGAMIDLGAHPMYLISWFMGKPRRVTSMFTSFSGRAAEDNAVSLIEFAGGGIGVSETGFVSSNNPMSMEISGTKGTILLSSADWKVRVSHGGGFRVIPEDEMPPALPTPSAMFVEGVLRDRPIEFETEAAVALSELMEAAYESHRTGKTVEIK